MERRGFHIGPYQVAQRLGRGGMGEVWLASRVGQRYVIKTLLPHLTEDRRAVEMFLKEARIASLLHSPNVVRIFETGTGEANAPYLVLEYVDGTSLDKLIGRFRRLPAPVAAYVGAMACAGLSDIHEQQNAAGQPLQIVHRDISPGNLLVSQSGEVKVSDFGIAKTFTTDPGGTTTVGTTKGKIVYMSPEQAKGIAVDRRTDLFALGVVLYEMLSGEIPYVRTRNDYEMLGQVVHGRRQPLAGRQGDFPRALLEVVDRALVLDPEQRFQTADQMRAALDDYLQDFRLEDVQRDLAALATEAARQQQIPATSRDTADAMPGMQVSDSMILRHTPNTVDARHGVAGDTQSEGDDEDEEEPVTSEPALPAAAAALELPRDVTRVRRQPSWWPAVVAAVLGLVATALVWFALAPQTEPESTTPPPVVAAAEPPTTPTPREVALVVDQPPKEVPAAVPVDDPTDNEEPAARAVKRRKPKPFALITAPPTDVYLGKKKLGRTPLEVPIDSRDGVALRLVSEHEGVNVEYQLTPQAGETTRKVDLPRATLQLRVDPWAEVTLDGRALGLTPLPPMSVYAGKHTVDLVNGDLKVRRRIDVDVAAGETKVVREKL